MIEQLHGDTDGRKREEINAHYSYTRRGFLTYLLYAQHSQAIPFSPQLEIIY